MWVINQWEKTGSVVYSMDCERKASKMFIIWLSVLGNQKQVQDKSINGHLTGVTKKKRFYWLTKTIALYKSFPLKVNS